MRTRVLLAVACLLAPPTLAASQGLGGAAAKEKQRRTQDQKKPTPAKTYTLDDVLSLPPVEAPGATNDAAGSASGASDRPSPRGARITTASRSAAAARAGSEEAERARAEARWRERVAGARARAEETRKKQAFFESLNLVPGYVYQDEKGREVIHSVRQLQGLTARARAERQAAEKALEDLLEEARRASVPPGWLR